MTIGRSRASHAETAMLVSENELQELVWRVLRGYGWPRAESKDIANAIVWLEMHQLDGLAPLRTLLEAPTTFSHQPTTISAETGTTITLHTANNIALLAGDLAVDLAIGKALETSRAVRVQLLDTPVPTLLIASAAAKDDVFAVDITTNTHVMRLLHNGDLSIAPQHNPETAAAAHIYVGNQPLPAFPRRTATHIPHHVSQQHYQAHLASGIAITNTDWHHLNMLALNSMVEATEESRQRGAGENAIIG